MIKKNWKMRLNMVCRRSGKAYLTQEVWATPVSSPPPPGENHSIIHMGNIPHKKASSQAKAYFSLNSLWRANSFTHYQQGE